MLKKMFLAWNIESVLTDPRLGPGESKVHNLHQLDEDEEKAAYHPEVHPGHPKVSLGDEKGADHSSNDNQVFEAPETENINVLLLL